jgi:hypothetical protein
VLQGELNIPYGLDESADVGMEDLNEAVRVAQCVHLREPFAQRPHPVRVEWVRAWPVVVGYGGRYEPGRTAGLKERGSGFGSAKRVCPSACIVKDKGDEAAHERHLMHAQRLDQRTWRRRQETRRAKLGRRQSQRAHLGQHTLRRQHEAPTRHLAHAP